MKLILVLISLLTPALSFAQDAAQVTPALSETAAPATPGVESLIFQLVIIFVIFYFLLIRPQQRKMKSHIAMVNQLKKGDNIITGAGFKGKVVKATEGDKFVDVEIADNVVVTVLRSSITDNADKPQPVANDNKAKKSK